MAYSWPDFSGAGAPINFRLAFPSSGNSKAGARARGECRDEKLISKFQRFLPVDSEEGLSSAPLRPQVQGPVQAVVEEEQRLG